jgi:hypothetical protein
MKKLDIFIAIIYVLLTEQFAIGQTFSTLGTGTNTNTSTTYPAPYGQYWFGAKQQFFITAAELSAAGISSGASISSIGFYVVQDNTPNTTSHIGFQVNIYNVGSTGDPLQNNFTSSTLVSSSITTNYNPSLGWNQHSVNPFIWNGTSNLVIQTCFNNTSYTDNALTYISTNLTGTSIKSRIQAADASNVCSSTSLSQVTSTTQRPHIRFGWIAVSSYCIPSSSICDEYIKTVNLNSINNTSACTSGGYINYSSISTSLTKGNQYTITVTPAIVGSTNIAYDGDEIAAWIDYNNDYTFSSTEKIAYVLVSPGWSNQFNFTVPTSSITGNVRMRIKISYSPNDGAIAPCANTTYGETEDYTINIVTNTNPPSSPTSISASNSSICSNETVSLTVSGNSGTTYWYSGSCGSSIGSAIGTGTSINVTPTSTTTYYARNYLNGIWSTNCVSNTISVNSVNTPSAPYTSSSNTCNQVIIYQSTPPTGITWYWQGTNSNGTSTALGSSSSYVVNTSGVYYLRARNTQGCWSANSSSISIIVNSSPSSPSNPTITGSQCNSATITRTGTPPSGITWYWQGTNSNGTSTSLGSGITYNASSTGTYYIRALSNNGCWSANSGSVSVILGVPSVPNTPTSNSPQCSSVTINQNGTAPNGVTWYWQGANGVGTSTSNSNISYTATSSGTYYLRALSSSGCWSNSSAGINVVISGYPSSPSSLNSNSPLCESVTINRNGSPPSGTTWYWQGTNSNGNETLLGSGPSFNVTSSGTYYLRAFKTPSCWSQNSSSISVNVLNSSSSNVIASGCDSYTLPNGIQVTNSGLYQSTILNTVGCDSNIIVNLTIQPSYNVVNTIYACENFTWSNGINYTNSNNNAIQYLTSTAGCDSIVHLNLFVGQPSFDTTYVESSALGSYEIGSFSYDQSGQYILSIPDQFGCDSIISLNLQIEPLFIENHMNSNFIIYPNPSNLGYFHINSTENYQIETVRDVSGRIIPFIKEANRLELVEKCNGIYFVEIGFELGKNQIYKICLQ